MFETSIRLLAGAVLIVACAEQEQSAPQGGRGGFGGMQTAGMGGMAAMPMGGVMPMPIIDPTQCFPNTIYGTCDTCMTCFGSPETFETCTRSCSDTAECGSAASTGATAECAMLTAGDQGVCVLRCEMDDQCPCGLSCVPSGQPLISICASAGG